MAHLTNKAVIAWLRTKFPTITFYNNFIDQDNTNCIGVYTRPNGRVQPQAVGGKASYGVKSMTLLIRGSNASSVSEDFVLGVWEVLRGSSNTEAIGSTTAWIQALSEPRPMGRDAQNIFEYVVDFDIYFRL